MVRQAKRRKQLAIPNARRWFGAEPPSNEHLDGWGDGQHPRPVAADNLIDTVQSNHLSYRAGLWDATEFCQQQRKPVVGGWRRSAISCFQSHGNRNPRLVAAVWLIAHNFDLDDCVGFRPELLIEGSLRAILRNIRLLLPALPRGRLPHRQWNCRISMQAGRSATS